MQPTPRPHLRRHPAECRRDTRSAHAQAIDCFAHGLAHLIDAVGVGLAVECAGGVVEELRRMTHEHGDQLG